MDSLGAEAEEKILDIIFEPAAIRHDVVRIETPRFEQANTSFEQKSLNDAELRAFIDDSTSRSDMIATKIVRIYYHPEAGITSHLSLFRRLWDSFRLDPYMIYMFRHNVPGFFQLPSTTSKEPLLKFYMNCQAYWFIWTYDTSTLSTNAVLISRRSAGGRDSWAPLQSRLKRHLALAGHPLYLAIVPALERVAFLDRFCTIQHKRIGGIEKETGFSHFHLDKPAPEMKGAEAQLAQLAEMSRLASSVLVGLADMTQHLESSTNVVDEALSFGSVTGSHHDPVMLAKGAEIKKIATVLHPQLKQRFGRISYLKERGENQLTVVCHFT